MNSDPFAKTEENTVKQQLLEDGSREDIVVQALQECQQAIDAGESIDREAILAKYPTIRDELSACLEGLELMKPVGNLDATEPSRNARTSLGQSLSPSATLGDFRIERELGRGGMGVVYEAEQLSVGRKVALKVLPYAAMLDKRQVARFQNEARAAATLEHPNIVPVYFVGNERGVYYYAMRLIDGKNLAEVLAELRGNQQSDSPVSQISSQLLERDLSKTTDSDAVAPLAKAETVRDQAADQSTSLASDHSTRGRAYFESVARLAKQAAEALDFAHSHGIIHRDIKPANIMLDDLGDAWVTDFGLARIESDAGMTMTGDIVGTLRYMSPEQTLAKRVTVDHRSDVYSLGATLYELLTLTPLFDGTNRADLLKKIAFDEPKPPSKFVKRIPADLETIVLKSLQKNPDDRYASAKEFAEDLDRYLSHQPVLARRTPISQRIRMWARRHPGSVASAAIVASVLLVATAVLGFMSARNQSALRSQEQAASQQIATSLSEKENALDAANANLNEALNAIDNFLVELSSEGGQGTDPASPIRGDLLRSAFEIYDKLEATNQMTAQLERRKLLALQRALRVAGATEDFERVRTEALGLANRLMEESPHDLQVLFAKINVLTHSRRDALDLADQTRTVFDLIEKEIEQHGSAGAMFSSEMGLGAHFAESMTFALMLNESHFGQYLKEDQWRLLRDAAVSLLKVHNLGKSGEFAMLASHAASLSYRLGDLDLAYELMRESLERSENVAVQSDLANVVEQKQGREAAAEFCEEQLRRIEQTLIMYPRAGRNWEYPRYQTLLARYWDDKADLKTFVAELERDIEQRHPLVRRYVLLGCLYRVLGKTNKELFYYQKAAPANNGRLPTGGEINDRTYQLLMAKGDYGAAAEVYGEDAAAHELKRKAAALFKAGDFKQALESNRKAFELDPRATSVINWVTPETLGPDPGFQHPEWVAGRKALLEYIVERYDELIASELAPNDGRYWHAKARAKGFLGRLEEALEDNIKAAELWSAHENQSEYAYCLLGLAKCFRALERYEEETEVLLKSIEARANHLESRSSVGVEVYMSYLARSYASREMFDEANKVYREMAELEPNNAPLQNNVAWNLATSSKESGRNGELAVKFAAKACELTDWKDAGFLDTLAAAYAEAGDFESAIKWQTKAIELAPEAAKNEIQSRLDLYQEGKPFREE